MSGRSPSPQPSLPRRVLRYPARVILNALMSLAALVLERRLRKALRPSTEPRPPG